MKPYQITLKSLATAGLLLAASCTYDFPEADPETIPTSGDADFSKFIAIGNSLTAGVADGALYDRSQQNSFPAILATQFAIVGGGDFVQPDVNSPVGCYNPGGGCTAGRLRLVVVNGSTTIQPITPGNTNALAPFTDKDNLSNFGVPGMSIGLAQTPLLGGPAAENPYFNPYYARFASNPGTSTALGDFVTELKDGTTFFSFWLGNIDVLGYATNGADQNDISRPLTSAESFTALYNNALNTILSENSTAKGVIANIPDVTSIPYFSTVPYNPIPLPSDNAAALNSGFAGYNYTLDVFKGDPFNLPAAEMDSRKISFAAGAGNKAVIVDETARDLGPYWDQLVAADQMSAEDRAKLEPYRRARQTTPTDLLVLPSSSIIGTLVGGNPQLINGLTIPLADKWVLIPSEVTEIKDRTTYFNSVIADIVDNNSDRLALVDANKVLSDLKTSGAAGINVNGIKLDATFYPPYGAFSVDGVHPNSRGYAYLANEFVKAINSTFDSRIPLANPNDYAGNDLPVPLN